MPDKRPFLEDGSQFGVSKTTFRRMRNSEKRELMIQWFHQNFENPDDAGTPWIDGEYQWIWGGPSDANEELGSKFGGIVSDKLIEDVARDVERGGFIDWVPVAKADYEDLPQEPPPLDLYRDKRGPLYGTPDEIKARAKARKALDQLQAKLDEPRPVGIGHNQPPEDMFPEEITEVVAAVSRLRVQFAKSSPSIKAVKKWTVPLRNVLITFGKWAGSKIDKGVDAAVKVIGAGIGAWILSHYVPPIHHAFGAIIHWLDVAAKTLF